MKGLAALAWSAAPRARVAFFLWSPVPAVRTWRASGPVDAAWLARWARAAAAVCAALVFGYAASFWLSARWAPPTWVWSYAALPVFIVVTEGIGKLAQLVGMLLGRRLPPVHDRPLTAASLAAFWGGRWNRYFGDWLREVPFRATRAPRPAAVTLVFLVSGVIHEVLIDLPLWLVYGRSLFGSMIGYFLLQALGLEVERRAGLRRARWGRLWTILVVVGPVPLVLNEGTLRIFHLR